MIGKGSFIVKTALIGLLAFVTAAAFSAYLSPNMLLAFGDVWAFCASLVR